MAVRGPMPWALGIWVFRQAVRACWFWLRWVVSGLGHAEGRRRAGQRPVPRAGGRVFLGEFLAAAVVSAGQAGLLARVMTGCAVRVAVSARLACSKVLGH